MPTYEFRCPEGHEFEKFYRTISGAESQSTCPVCGKLAERFMSPAGFAFKGSGFYLTDYGKNAHRDSGTSGPKPVDSGKKEGGDAPAAKADSASSSTDAPRTEKKADAKPAESKPAAPSKPSASE